MTDKQPVVRAIDVGFGNVKFTLGFDTVNREVLCDMFPSLAPKSHFGDLGTHGCDRDTVQIKIDGRTYEVGKDVAHATSMTDSRTMEIMFPTKPEYLALVRGALHYMGEAEIDMLVVGLPVSSIASLGQQLKAKMIGDHDVGGRIVTVKNCLVVPQPVGGLWDYAVRGNGGAQLQEATTLIVDPGWFTLDWVVATNMKLMQARAGSANNFGMGAILRAVGQSLAKHIAQRDGKAWDLTEQMIMKIDRGLRGDMHVNVLQRRESLEPHLEAGRQIMRSGMDILVNSIGSKSDIDAALTVGGPAKLYVPVLCEYFGAGAVRHAVNPVYANVRGFHVMGLKATKALLAAA